MRSKLLLPAHYKWIGLGLLIPSLALAIAVYFFEFQFKFLTISKADPTALLNFDVNLTDELALSGLILGLLFLCFAREHHEDEYISQTRLESLQWAVIVNYALLILATWLVHGISYLQVMVYNMLTIPLIFLFRFHFVLGREKNNAQV